MDLTAAEPVITMGSATREEEVLSDTDETNDTEEIIRAKARLREAKEYTAKAKRLYELAASRLEEIEKGVLSAYEASPEEVELEMYTQNISCGGAR
ncbi:hypothetical protein DAPPUDRAFT_240404 [Daphnia pulex]|uniref:Uncharacterized protein n=1 Tax=Daphnia pulex TaxID=6669 RepID=E9GBG9_DAPPU|nr:hypothetical protein DAPPUDRAFT_240404 [Daphnia pulex]|eukprot:EFX82956.1 hypothetical protein DAPPUDRAFT_240404 [Daphnia pulex]